MYTVEYKTFDRYDIISFIYGGIIALQDTSTTLALAQSNECFIATFESVTQVDYMIQNIEQVFTTSRYFNVLVFDPVKIFNNFAAAYE